jgi:lambda family phage portal protein
MANPFKRALQATSAPRKRNAFGMGAFNRLTSDWVMAASRSADGELRYELRTMRNRARELVRNSPFGARYQQLMAENVVGPVGRSGFQLCAQNLKKGTTELHVVANNAIEEAFLDWARPENCDAQGKLSLGEILCLLVSGWGTDGELLGRFLRGRAFGEYGLKLQVLDPDYLVDTPHVVGNQKGVPTLNQGIEQDEWGAPIAYHLWTRHPYDLQGRWMGLTESDRTRILAGDILHAFIPLRAGQSRGIPHAAAVGTTLKMLDGYIEAELVAARIASATMGAVEDLPNGDGPAPNPNTGIGTGLDGEDGSQAPGYNDIPAEAEPGALLDLRGKGKLALWDPQHPTSAFPDFTRMMSHFAAMGLGISYGTLTGDLSQANYGSLRIGMLDERTHWERYQNFMIEHVMERIYREWLKMALLNDKIPGITDKDAKRWTRHQWMGRGFDWIDPLKDAQGDLLEVAAGTQSLTRIAAKRGRDLEQVLQERAQEIELFKKYNVPCTLVATGSAATPPEKDDSDNTANSSTAADAASKSWDGALPVLPITQQRSLRAVGT